MTENILLSVEDVVVYTDPRSGRDIAVAGIQVCGGSRYDTGFFRGLQVFDVSTPAAPKQLALLNTGCCTRGLHELEVQHRGDLNRSFVFASVPTSERGSSSASSQSRACGTSSRSQSSRAESRISSCSEVRVKSMENG